MRRPHGHLQIFDPDGPLIERDTVVCGHCQRIVPVKPGSASTVYLISHRDGRITEESGAFCRVCMRPVCLSCHDVGTCRTFEAWLEQVEADPHGIRIGHG